MMNDKLKQFPVMDVEDVGDEDAKLWMARATRNEMVGVGVDRDSLRAREKAIANLEEREAYFAKTLD